MRPLGCSFADTFSLKCAGSLDSLSSQNSNSVSFPDISLHPVLAVLPRDGIPLRVAGRNTLLGLLSASYILPPRVAGLLDSELALGSEGSLWVEFIDFDVAALLFKGGVPMRNSAQSARMVLDASALAFGVVNGLGFSLSCFLWST